MIGYSVFVETSMFDPIKTYQFVLHHGTVERDMELAFSFVFNALIWEEDKTILVNT
jgi:hypothetical protein